MADEITPPWDYQTDQFINEIDSLADSKTQLSLRDILLNPEKTLAKEGILQKLQDAKKAVNDYFKDMLEGLSSEQKQLDQELAGSDLLYTKIENTINSKAASARIPYLDPYFVYINIDTREEIIIEKYGDDTELLIGKLLTVSNYAANLSGSYKEHRLGSWLFSGAKTYALSIRQPTSIILDIDRSSGTINDILDSLIDTANAESPKE